MSLANADRPSRSEYPVASRVVTRWRETRFDNLAIVNANDDGRIPVDHSEFGEDSPFEVEKPVSLTESDTRSWIDGTGARDHEVESAQAANEIQINLLCKHLGAVEGSRETGLRVGNTPWREKMEAHGHGDRLKEWPVGTDERPLYVWQTVVRRDEHRTNACVTGQLPESRVQLFTTREVWYEPRQVVDEPGVGQRHISKPLPHCLPYRCSRRLAVIIHSDGLRLRHHSSLDNSGPRTASYRPISSRHLAAWLS